MTATFIEASIADLETVVSLVQAYYQYDEIYFDPDSARRGLTELLTDRSLGRVWMIQSGNEIAGYLVLTFAFDVEFNGRQGTITDFYLRPEYRRIGIGSQTFAFVEQFCREMKIGAIELQVERDNIEAQAFYRRMGFESVDRIPMNKLIGPA
jgi:ribosomal protein S18 acetylase RimI-like enzyme